MAKKWKWLLIVALLATASCTYIRKPKLDDSDQSKLLEYLRYSPTEDVRSSAAMVLLLFDHQKYTPRVAEQIDREKQGWMKLRLMSLLAQWGDGQAIKYLDPYTKQDKDVVASSGEKICLKDAAEQVIQALRTPLPARNLPRQVPVW